MVVPIPFSPLVNRRSVLRSAAAVSVFGAGCLGARTEIILEYLLIASWDREDAHTVSVSITYNGEPLHDGAYRLDPMENNVGDFERFDELPTDPGQYVVTVELLDHDDISLSVEPGVVWDDDCATLSIELFPEESGPTFFYAPHRPCEEQGE